MRGTLYTTGRALFFTSVILAAGFGTYTFATMQNLVNMGAFTTFAIVSAFVADIMVAPACIVLLWRHPESTTDLAPTTAGSDDRPVSRLPAHGDDQIIGIPK